MISREPLLDSELWHLVPEIVKQYIDDRDLKLCECCVAAYPIGKDYDCFFGYNHYGRGKFYSICWHCDAEKHKFYELIEKGLVKISDFPKSLEGYKAWKESLGSQIQTCPWRVGPKYRARRRFIDVVK